MKIAFSTSGEGLEAPLEGRFGRAARFLVYDTDSSGFTMADNARSVEAAQGAGISAAENVARTGAQAVVTGNCGPKAFRALAAAGIKVYTCNLPTVAEALAAFQAGKLEQADSANVAGHWM